MYLKIKKKSSLRYQILPQKNKHGGPGQLEGVTYHFLIKPILHA